MRKGKKGKSRTRKNARPDKYLINLRKKLGIIPLQEAKENAMKKAYAVCKGDAILAAALLGIGKTSLYRFLNEQESRGSAWRR
jgi:transcriptional regulator of acetoin/glycerol metabolism